jgi:hypothetical protein
VAKKQDADLPPSAVVGRTLRAPKALWDAIDAVARKHRRSGSQHAVWLLEQVMTEQEGYEPPEAHVSEEDE